MDVLKGKTLLNFGGSQISAEKALKRTNTVVYYFSASWCDSRFNMLPKIKQIFKVSPKNNPPHQSGIRLGELQPAPQPGDCLRVVWLRRGRHDGGFPQESRGLVRPSFRRRRNLVPNFWRLLKFEVNLFGFSELKMMFDISHIPAIVVVRSDGLTVTRTGVADVEKLGLNVLVAWTWIYIQKIWQRCLEAAA